MKGLRITTLLTAFICTITVGVVLHAGATERENLAPETQWGATIPDIRLYTSKAYGFHVAYPFMMNVIEASSNSSHTIDTWLITDNLSLAEGTGSSHCATSSGRTFQMTLRVADTWAGDSYQKAYDQKVATEYTSRDYWTVIQGGKTYKVNEQILTGCTIMTEVLWKDDSGRYIAVFSYPSSTKREQDYWDIIQSFGF